LVSGQTRLDLHVKLGPVLQTGLHMRSHLKGDFLCQAGDRGGISVQHSLCICLVQGASAAVALEFGHVSSEGLNLSCNTLFLVGTQRFGSASLKGPVKFVYGSTTTAAFAKTIFLSPALAGAWSSTLTRALGEGN
jgi:hypothetical protein